MIEQYKKADFYFRFPFLLPPQYLNLDGVEPDDLLLNVFYDVPEGWANGFMLDMCEKIRNELIEWDALYEYKVLKVCYKNTSFEWEDFGAPRDSEVRDIIQEYQKKAPYICTVCGQKAERVQKSLNPRQLCVYCWQSEYGLDNERIWKDPGDKEYNKTIFELKERPFYYVDEWLKIKNRDLFDRVCNSELLLPYKEKLSGFKQPVEFIFWSIVSLLCGALLAYFLVNTIKLRESISYPICFVFLALLGFAFYKRYVFFSDDDGVPEFRKYALCRGAFFALEIIVSFMFGVKEADLFKVNTVKLIIEYTLLFFVNKYFVFK